MKQVRIALIAGLSVLFLASCVSTKTLTEPGDKYTGLVVGRIVMKASGFDNRYNASVNGERRSNIFMDLLNLDTKKKIEIRTYGNSGIFYAAYLPEGQYTFVSHYYRFMTNNSWASLEVTGQTPAFTVVPGKVTNLGNWEWISNNTLDTHLVHLDLSLGMSGVREQFSEDYPESGWNDFEWVDAQIVPTR